MSAELIHFSQAFLLTASLIMVIGAQNMYILKMGLLRQHVLLLTSTCIISDAALIWLGISGFDKLFNGNPLFECIVTLGGGVFLCALGLRALQTGIQGTSHLHASKSKSKPISWHKAWFIFLAMTFLNPHVYFDTIVLIGGTGAHQPPEFQMVFYAGAVAASATWFLSLGYGARLLEPLFQSKRAWQIFDISMAMVLWAIALYLVWPYLFNPVVRNELLSLL